MKNRPLPIGEDASFYAISVAFDLAAEDRGRKGRHRGARALTKRGKTAHKEDASALETLSQALRNIPDNVPGLAHAPATVDVAALRGRTWLSQRAFASCIGVSVGTLRNWEQRRRSPQGPARVLLALIERDPRVIERTLGGV